MKESSLSNYQKKKKFDKNQNTPTMNFLRLLPTFKIPRLSGEQFLSWNVCICTCSGTVASSS